MHKVLKNRVCHFDQELIATDSYYNTSECADVGNELYAMKAIGMSHL